MFYKPDVLLYQIISGLLVPCLCPLKLLTDICHLTDLFLLRRTAGLSIFFLIFTFVPCPDVEVTSSSSINASINVKPMPA